MSVIKHLKASVRLVRGTLKAKKKLVIISIFLGIPAFILATLDVYTRIFPQLPVLSSETIRIEDDEHCVSFILTNPSDNYAILEEIWLEVIDYEDNEFYTLPEPEKYVVLSMMKVSPWIKATSGPVERYEEEVELTKEHKKCNLFEQSKKVFPKGETAEFKVTVVTNGPGKYKYKILQKWQIPQKRKSHMTATKDYLIENLIIHDIGDTYELFKTLKKELIIFSFNIEDIKNIFSVEALEKVPNGVDIKLLVPKKPIQATEYIPCFIFDKEKVLIEVDNQNRDYRIGKLLVNKNEVEKITGLFGITKIANFKLYGLRDHP